MIPHTNNWGYLLLAITLVAGVLIGWGVGHWRAYAECCDCCTCQTCEPDIIEPRLGRGVGHSFDEDGTITDRWVKEVDGLPPFGPATNYPVAERRHAVVLEPGPTIYPALAELAGEVMDGSHSDPEPIDSTWLRLLMLDWDRRYPIPQEVGR